jgi:hypothetical protein
MVQFSNKFNTDMGILEGIKKGLKVVSGVQAYQDRKEAKDIKGKAQKLRYHIESEDEKVRQKSEKILNEFGECRLNSLNVVGVFLNFLKILEKKFKVKEYEILAQANITPVQYKQMASVEMNAREATATLVAGGCAASAALAGVPSLVTGAVSALATASTGTAISTLSGAAATNATLAWLGGGSLAAGGGGMAAGSAVLTGITGATMGVFALAAAGIVSSAVYSKKLKDANEYYEKLKVEEARLRAAWVVIEGINKRALELQSLTSELTAKTVNQLNYLEPLIYDFDNDDAYYVETFQKSALLSKAVGDLSQVPLLDENGTVSKDSELIQLKMKSILNTEL